jgi:hypothetical protein
VIEGAVDPAEAHQGHKTEQRSPHVSQLFRSRAAGGSRTASCVRVPPAKSMQE